jgi:hypothetical protein
MRSFMQKHWPLIQEMSTESLWEVYCVASYKVYGKMPAYSTKMQRKELITHIKMLHNAVKTKPSTTL